LHPRELVEPFDLFHLANVVSLDVKPTKRDFAPKCTIWGCVGIFQQVYFVIGFPSYELDLLRASVFQVGV
jgi:hypothetical protein